MPRSLRKSSNSKHWTFGKFSKTSKNLKKLCKFVISVLQILEFLSIQPPPGFCVNGRFEHQMVIDTLAKSAWTFQMHGWKSSPFMRKWVENPQNVKVFPVNVRSINETSLEIFWSKCKNYRMPFSKYFWLLKTGIYNSLENSVKSILRKSRMIRFHE